MATDNNIKNFTAADIEKYHKGLLSLKERHDLEKAALDDPFLADALEGYSSAGVNVNADIEELKTRLAERTDQAKVIPIRKAGGGGIYPFLRVAAIILVLVGGAYFTYQFAFDNKEERLAKAGDSGKVETKTTDTVTGSTTNGILSRDETVAPGTIEEIKGTTAKGVNPPTTKPGNNTPSEKIESGNASGKASGELVTSEVKTSTVISAPSVQKDVATVPGPVAEDKNNKKESVKEGSVKPTQDGYAVVTGKDADEKRVKQIMDNRRNVTMMRKAADQNYRNPGINTFRGQVTDASNVGIPFANVTNIQDNAGTYTDANGNFNFTSPDTLLNVQVRSIGFENKVSLLKNNVQFNQVVLQDDRRSLNEMVISNQQPNAEARTRNANANNTLEEPEPADGWSNYDTYLANNLVVPEDFKTKPTPNSSVEISFEVDKNGEPVNIKVERSLCGKCDKEAIRLIKEGPKWKRNANKKGRTTVTINF